MASYDTALFQQRLRQLAKFHTVTRADVEEAFWHASRDLESDLEQFKPEKVEIARQWVREEIVPRLAERLSKFQLRLRD